MKRRSKSHFFFLRRKRGVLLINQSYKIRNQPTPIFLGNIVPEQSARYIGKTKVGTLSKRTILMRTTQPAFKASSSP